MYIAFEEDIGVGWTGFSFVAFAAPKKEEEGNYCLNEWNDSQSVY